MVRNKLLKTSIMKFEDLEIWDYVSDYNNYKVSSKGRVWNVRKQDFTKPFHVKGYPAVNLYKNGKQKIHKIHRLVALTFYFMDDGNETKAVDHIDRDKTNNNIFNLRFCTTSENKRNTGLVRTNTSGFKGVNWDKVKQKWRAQIKTNGKKKHLGHFNTKEEAYEAYKKASKEYHGDFGYTP
jgi:hypothetical protein